MELSKKLAIRYTAQSLSGSEVTGMCLREEFFDIIINHEFYTKVAMSPDNTNEFIVGFLIGTGIIQNPDEILTNRLCEANKFHIQLAGEVTVKIKSAEGIVEFAQLRAAPPLADIVPIVSGKQFPATEVMEIAKSIGTDIRYFAANPYTNTIIPDSNPLHAADKLIGTGLTDGILITNAPATIELMIRCYYAGIPLAVCQGIPTGGAISYAKKAGITLISEDVSGDYLVYSDSAHRLVY